MLIKMMTMTMMLWMVTMNGENENSCVTNKIVLLIKIIMFIPTVVVFPN